MDETVCVYVVDKTYELMSAPSCSSEAKAASQSWLDAIVTENEDPSTL